MKPVVLILLAGSAAALAAGAVPGPDAPPRQVPPATPPTVQVPQATAPTATAPQATAPTTTAPQAAAPAIHLTQALPVGPAPAEAGQAFEGTWSASGQRQVLPTEAGVSALTIQLSGAVSLRTSGGLSRGFRGEVLGFDDGTGLAAGRAVWTDDRGDRIFSVLQGDVLAAGNRQMRALITGGTGRYAGFSGEYEFHWRHLITVEGAQVSGQAVNLRGHVRPGSAR
ncbi:MAG TPA: hypothetical protein VFV78_10635 [Vicinamibacterales bacterium]|nr:hypothetical protein [Vicinamibacterales bacterium]